MTSRTADGKHTARFIILRKSNGGDVFERSVAVSKAFPTRELAQVAIDAAQLRFPDVTYKIRQK